MSRQLVELENVLRLLIDEHRKLLVEVEKHRNAIKAMNVAAMDESRVRQEALRLKITVLEKRRAGVTSQLAAGHKMQSVTLTQLAELNPQFSARLLALRDELRSVIGQISGHTQVAGKVAGAVLGHLNTVVRLLTGAMRQAGVYTKRGLPQTAPRIGVMDAVG